MTATLATLRAAHDELERIVDEAVDVPEAIRMAYHAHLARSAQNLEEWDRFNERYHDDAEVIRTDPEASATLARLLGELRELELEERTFGALLAIRRRLRQGELEP
jgi:hypothetical protein